MRSTSSRAQIPGRRRGFTLLEMVVVIAMLTLVMVLTAGILTAGLRAQQAALHSSHQLIARSNLADQFRGDVARATGAPETWEEQTAGPACLILREADGKHVVYQWRKGQLERSVVAGGERSSRVLPVGDGDVSVEFARSAAGRVLSLRLIDVRKPNMAKHVTEFAAALGGDFQ